MRTTMYAVVLNDGGDTVDSLYSREAEAWMAAEDWDDGEVWVAVVDVTLGTLVSVTSEDGAAVARQWELTR